MGWVESVPVSFAIGGIKCRHKAMSEHGSALYIRKAIYIHIYVYRKDTRPMSAAPIPVRFATPSLILRESARRNAAF